MLGRDGTGYSTRYRPPVGVEVDVTRQDDTTVGVRHVLFLAARFLTVSSPSPAPHVSRFLVGAVDHSTIERLSAARTFNPHIRASRGGLDKAIRRCKAGVSEAHRLSTIAVVRTSREIATSPSSHGEEIAEYLITRSAAAGQSILHEADSHDRFDQSS